MSEKPNPSLDCASLVRFSVLPLYHGGELQSCWAVIRSSSLLQTLPPNPLYPPFPTGQWKKLCLYSSHPCSACSSHQPLPGFALLEKEKKRVELKSSKTSQRNFWGYEKNIGNVKRTIEISLQLIKYGLTAGRGLVCMCCLAWIVWSLHSADIYRLK